MQPRWPRSTPSAFVQGAEPVAGALGDGSADRGARAMPHLDIPHIEVAREVARNLPGALEVTYHGDPWFNVGRKSYALWSSKESCWILKLPKPLQERMFEEDPDTFVPMRAGKLLWSYVLAQRLPAARFAELLVASWRTIALKRVQAVFDAERALEPIPNPVAGADPATGQPPASAASIRRKRGTPRPASGSARG